MSKSCIPGDGVIVGVQFDDIFALHEPYFGFDEAVIMCKSASGCSLAVFAIAVDGAFVLARHGDMYLSTIAGS